MNSPPDVVVLGAGLAGCEAALQLARRGLAVRLYERKPESMSEAGASPLFAELVCSNSFRARTPENAVGLLKEELQSLGSFFMKAALLAEIPAGGALAVDRERFASYLTGLVTADKNIEIVNEELNDIPPEGEDVIIATGPLTGGGLAEKIAGITGSSNLHFYDAIAPIVEASAIDYEKAFFASRYGKGGDDYLNLPLDETRYRAFVDGLKSAEKVLPESFESAKYFEGCLPVDLLAERGPDTLAFGPMKPVGLVDPNTGKRPFAVVQLRSENKERTAFSLVGFQTRLKHTEQQRLFRTLPGLENAEFMRLGSVHRNTFIDAPGLLDSHLRLKRDKRITFAGQISGVEGYVESAAMGLMAGLFTASRHIGKPLEPPCAETMTGALLNYLREARKGFQPSNVTHAMLPPLAGKRKLKKRDRKRAYMERARVKLAAWIEESGFRPLHLPL